MKSIPQGLSMAYPLMPHSPVITLATTNHASNATTLAIFASTANGMSAQFAKSIALAILNDVAPLAALTLVPLHHHRPPPPNLI